MAEERPPDNPEDADPASEGGGSDAASNPGPDAEDTASGSAAESAVDPVTSADAAHAMEAIDSVEEAAQAVQTATEELPLPDFDGAGGSTDLAGMQLLSDVSLNVKIELGRTKMFVEDVLRLNMDSVIELDKAAGDPVDIYVNDRHVARGEVLVLSESFAVRVSEIIDPRSGEALPAPAE